MKAVLWTDTFQIVIVAIAFLAVIIGGSMNVGGFREMWRINEQGGRIDFWKYVNYFAMNFILDRLCHITEDGNDVLTLDQVPGPLSKMRKIKPDSDFIISIEIVLFYVGTLIIKPSDRNKAS